MRDLPRIYQKLIGEPWLVTPAWHRNAAAIFHKLEPTGLTISERQSERMQPGAEFVAPGLAVIPVSGPIGKHLSAFEMDCGGGFCLTRFNSAIDKAVASGAQAIVFDMDSPGGTVTGVAETGAKIAALKDRGTVAAGIMSINRHHGGAIEDCARYLASLTTRAKSTGQSLDAIANEEVTRIKSTGDRISGFGHRVHTKDPRTGRLFELAGVAGLQETPASHIGAARAIERAFAAIGKPLPINVDGAIGAILADLGLDPRVFNGIFMIARTPGLVAHVTEEQTRERPMRRIDPVNHAYDGPLPG